MTGRELIEQAVKHFPILYLKNTEDGDLDYLLLKALGTFQDKAGCTQKVLTVDQETTVAVPDNFLDIAMCCDAERKFYPVEVVGEDFVVQDDLRSKKPFTITYFVDLKGLDPAEDDLPSDIISTCLEYLIALIDIPNTQRARRVALSTGQQIEERSDEELLQRKQALEEDMEESQEILPSIMVC